MTIEPQSKAEARVLKRVRLSQHWTARVMAPIALCILPLGFIIGGLYLFWRIGQVEAATFVVCVDTGKDLVPCPEIPFSYFPGAFLLIMGFFFVVESWLVLFVMRERRIMNNIVTRIEKEDSEQSPAGDVQRAAPEE